MIQNIVFDMGGVLIEFDPKRFVDRYPLSDAHKELLLSEVFRSVEWVMLDSGIMTEEQAEGRILPRLPQQLHAIACQLIEAWDEPLLPIEGMEALLKSLKGNGYRLYLLSNAAKRQHQYWQRAQASHWMDGVLISADVHLLKPDPGIYQVFLEKFGLDASECIFIDDTPANVESATHMGMEGIVFRHSADALLTELKKHGIKV